MKMIDEIWEKVTEEFGYFIGFEWLGDSWEFITGMFENLTEFSPIGVVYGVIMVLLVYLFRGSVFAFVSNMSLGSKIIMYPLFYIFAFFCGYFMGRKVWE